MPSWRADLALAWWRDATWRRAPAGSVVVGIYFLDSGSAPSYGSGGNSGTSGAIAAPTTWVPLCGGDAGYLEQPPASWRQPRRYCAAAIPHLGHARRRFSSDERGLALG